MSWLLVLACSKPPAVSSVDPAEGRAGDVVRVLGENFADGASVTLGGQPMGDVKVLGAIALEATVPEGAAEGAQDLVVTLPDGKSAQVSFTVTVPVVADAGEPCAGPYTAYSQLALGRDLVVIDRHYKEPKDKRETLRLDVGDVERVQFGRYVFEDDAICTAIFVKMKNGDVHLFDDDLDEDLFERAQEMAQGMQKPIDIVADVEPEEAG